jgi:hypothetical protein
VYPNSDPVAMFAAQLPGSIKPTVTSNPGPIYLKISSAPKTGLWSFLFRSLINPKELNRFLRFNMLEIFTNG